MSGYASAFPTLTWPNTTSCNCVLKASPSNYQWQIHYSSDHVAACIFHNHMIFSDALLCTAPAMLSSAELNWFIKLCCRLHNKGTTSDWCDAIGQKTSLLEHIKSHPIANGSCRRVWTFGHPTLPCMCFGMRRQLRWHVVSHSQVSVMFTVYAMLPPVTSIICMPPRNRYISSRLVTHCAILVISYQIADRICFGLWLLQPHQLSTELLDFVV